MARHKTPTAVLKLQRTYRADKNGKNRADEILPDIIDTAAVVECPAEITDKYIKEYFNYHTKMLINLQLLSPADLPELTDMYLTLQQERQLRTALLNLDPIADAESYDRLSKLIIRLGNRFSALAVRYYISPTARMTLQLSSLAVDKAKHETENLSITQKMLKAKQA
jgi:hypothetical protein